MGKGNERGAGRKPVFSEEQIIEIQEKRKQGMTVSALAKEYGVSRQTLSGYLNKKDQHMEMMIESYRIWRELNRPFKHVDVIDYTMRMDFMCEEERCFPRTRGHMHLILDDLELDAYDPVAIIEKTHGTMKEDLQWIKLSYFNPLLFSREGGAVAC